jgi:CxxC motif-containing protein
MIYKTPRGEDYFHKRITEGGRTIPIYISVEVNQALVYAAK